MSLAARLTIDRSPAAESAEIQAIKAEKLLFNGAHNNSPEAGRRLVEYLIDRGRTDLLAPAVSRG
jgi:hypothetical protein